MLFYYKPTTSTNTTWKYDNIYIVNSDFFDVIVNDNYEYRDLHKKKIDMTDEDKIKRRIGGRLLARTSLVAIGINVRFTHLI
ncbi:unnamed protein product [Rotaria magnacalcarata]|uniref:Uncharacterized protein n=1 Tax=Rotaria magnacalcarata TaxID=392030 RepID=A0A8S3AUG6_9BILA|nr:unnamed protein product [Rotaria magnacalcarata]CAF4900953.1 unnamed protein product [Rotaria magnacalcarata]